MTLNAAIEGALPTLRAEAEARMQSRCRIESVAVTPHPLTGKDVEQAELVTIEWRGETLSDTPCRVRADDGQAMEADVESAQIGEVRSVLHVPWDTPGLRPGLRATITASDSPAVIGNQYRLVRPHEGDQATAQRWGVESWAQQMI